MLASTLNKIQDHKITLKNYITFNVSAVSPGLHKPAGYKKTFSNTFNIQQNYRFIKKIESHFYGTCNDFANIYISIGGNNFYYTSPHNQYVYGCYTSVNIPGEFIEFVNYNLNREISCINNQLIINITQEGSCQNYTLIDVSGYVTIYFE